MVKILYIALAIILFAFILYAVDAKQVEYTFANEITEIPPAAVMISSVLALIGGAAYSAQKLSDPLIIVKSVPLEIIKDILSAIVAGIMTFFICTWLNFATVLQAACITISGYGGSRVLERYLLSAINRIDKVDVP